MSDSGPIGVFDSGVGGISVLREIRSQLPREDVIYFGDQIHVPYGPRPKAQICLFAVDITDFLLERSAKIIVVACNTASAAALSYLRATFPELPFVGMEPALKPAAEGTRTGKVGVLATPTTFRGELYASIMERFGSQIAVYESDCPGLVQEIEAGELDSAETRRILREALDPMVRGGIDTVVLGCTHYPFVAPLIREMVGERIRIIDPAPSVARQTSRLLEAGGRLNRKPDSGSLTVFTSGDADALQRRLPAMLGETAPVKRADWIDDTRIRG